MIRTWLGFSLGLATIFAGDLCAQAGAIVDSMSFDRKFGYQEFVVNIPVGQTFVNSALKPNFTYVRAYRPDIHTRPIIKSDTLRDRIVTLLTWKHDKSSSSFSTEVSSSNQTGTYHYQCTKSASVQSGNPENYLMELSPDRTVPTALNLTFGYGSARLDLSDLSLKRVNVSSSTTDVIISYQKPNRLSMSEMTINGGMSRIVIRNLEMAKAEKVRIENGMGNTKILMGNGGNHATQVELLVGAGSCIFMVQKDVPLKLVVNQSFFSSLELPATFSKTEENTYVNQAYQANQTHASVVSVELGIGSFTLINFD